MSQYRSGILQSRVESRSHTVSAWLSQSEASVLGFTWELSQEEQEWRGGEGKPAQRGYEQVTAGQLQTLGSRKHARGNRSLMELGR